MTRHKNEHDPQLDEVIADLKKVTRDQLQSFEDEFEAARVFIRKNPLLSVLGAATLGFFVSRLFRRKKVIYLEKSKP